MDAREAMRFVPQVSLATVDLVEVTMGRSAILVHATLQPTGTKVRLRLWMPYVGLGHGMTMLPREGDELIAMFPGGDLDMGVAIWGMYNGVDPVPDGTAEDVVLFEGRPGDNAVIHIRGFVRVEIDEDELRLVRGNRATEIGVNESLKVGVNRTTEIGANCETTIFGNRQADVFGRCDTTVFQGRSTTVFLDDQLTVLLNRHVEVLGNRSATVAGTDTTTVLGARTVAVLGNELNTVQGNHSRVVQGNSEILVNGGMQVVVTAPMSVQAVASLTVVSLGPIVVQGLTIDLNPVAP
jgi:type VI secretion system secreted protein VgrG